MKKYKTFVVKCLSVSLLAFFGWLIALTIELEPTYATSGACSWHGGVDCNAGRDWDGSVICEDGWTDSSVSYSDADACENDAISLARARAESDLLLYYCPNAAFWMETLQNTRTACFDTYYGSEFFIECTNNYKTTQEQYGLYYYSYASAVRSCGAESKAKYTSCYYDAFDSTLEQCKKDVAEKNSSVFSDVLTSNKYYTAINELYAFKVIEGYDDGTYKPDIIINRAEFTKILIGAGYSPYISKYTGMSCFTDVSSTQWYAPYVCLAQSQGIVNGYPDGSFLPEKNISVAEALKMTFEAIVKTVPDAEGEWYQKYLNYAEANGLYLEAWSSVDQKLTRGEMAELIYRTMMNL